METSILHTQEVRKVVRAFRARGIEVKKTEGKVIIVFGCFLFRAIQVTDKNWVTECNSFNGLFL